MPDFGLTATTEPLSSGPTRNPWNLDYSVGGSSGGSAALVAAGAVPLAHANDGGGSIRIPASACGLVGLKPSCGRIVMPERMTGLPIKIAAQGVVTSTVRETAAFIAEIEKFDSTLEPVGLVNGPGRRLRIAIVDGGPGGIEVDPQVQAVCDAAARACEALGHSIDVIEFPYSLTFGRDFLRYWAMLAAAIELGGRSGYRGDFDRMQLEPFTLGLARQFRSVALKMPNSIHRLKRFAATAHEVYLDHDVIISPVLATRPPPIGYLAPDEDFRTHLVRLLRFASFTLIQNISGSPAISLPLGVTTDGLPIGVQFAARVGAERTLLELAFELESAQGWSSAP